jgi:hypothetical protein
MIRLRLDLLAIAIAFTGYTTSRALVQTPGGQPGRREANGSTVETACAMYLPSHAR